MRWTKALRQHQQLVHINEQHEALTTYYEQIFARAVNPDQAFTAPLSNSEQKTDAEAPLKKRAVERFRDLYFEILDITNIIGR